MKYNKIIDYLYNDRGIHSVDLSLVRIEKLLKKLGNPQEDLNVILVAGTNGKGSTSTMISSILREAGYKVGLYTSPHLIRFTERFMIDGEEITKEDVERIFNRIFPSITDQTYFEVITAMAYLYFKEQDVDFAVMEVGMGGRLDATNVTKPLVSVITNISLEHTKYLGSTTKDIAYEKAGIIKEGGYVVTAAEGEVYDIINEICMKKQATLFKATPTGLFKLGMNGEFQKINAGTAIKTVKALKYFGIEISKYAIINGLEKASIKGRLQFIRQNVLVDCAHNPGAFEALILELHRLKQEQGFKNLHFVFGAMKDKDISTIIGLLEPLASSFVLTRPRGDMDEMLDRAEEPKNIQKLLTSNKSAKSVYIIDLPMQALKKALSIAGKEDLIVVCGSCFLAGDILRG